MRFVVYIICCIILSLYLCIHVSGDIYLGAGVTDRRESLHDIDLSSGQSFSHFGADIFWGLQIGG